MIPDNDWIAEKAIEDVIRWLNISERYRDYGTILTHERRRIFKRARRRNQT